MQVQILLIAILTAVEAQPLSSKLLKDAGVL